MAEKINRSHISHSSFAQQIPQGHLFICTTSFSTNRRIPYRNSS